MWWPLKGPGGLVHWTSCSLCLCCLLCLSWGAGPLLCLGLALLGRLLCCLWLLRCLSFLWRLCFLGLLHLLGCRFLCCLGFLRCLGLLCFLGLLGCWFLGFLCGLLLGRGYFSNTESSAGSGGAGSLGSNEGSGLQSLGKSGFQCWGQMGCAYPLVVGQDVLSDGLGWGSFAVLHGGNGGAYHAQSCWMSGLLSCCLGLGCLLLWRLLGLLGFLWWPASAAASASAAALASAAASRLRHLRCCWSRRCLCYCWRFLCHGFLRCCLLRRPASAAAPRPGSRAGARSGFCHLLTNWLVLSSEQEWRSARLPRYLSA